MVITSRSTINSVFFNFRFHFSKLLIHYGRSGILRNDTFNSLCWSSSSTVSICCDDVKCSRAKTVMVYWKKSTHLPTGLIVSLLILLELLVVVGGWKYKKDLMSNGSLVISDISNTHQLGLVMYTDYILFFQLNE